MGGLLHLVQWGVARPGCGPTQSPPRCTKCNSPPSNTRPVVSAYAAWHQMVPIGTEWWCTEANESTQTHCYNPVAPTYQVWAYYAHGWQRRCQEDPVSLPSGRLELVMHIQQTLTWYNCRSSVTLKVPLSAAHKTTSPLIGVQCITAVWLPSAEQWYSACIVLRSVCL